MTDPHIVGSVKRSMIDRLHEFNDGFLPHYEWVKGPTDLMPAFKVNGRSVRFGVCVTQELAEFGTHSPYTPLPISQSAWDHVCKYLMGESDDIEVRQ